MPRRFILSFAANTPRVITTREVRRITGQDLSAAVNAVDCGMIFESYDVMWEFVATLKTNWGTYVNDYPLPDIKIDIYDGKVPVVITKLNQAC